MVVIKVESVVKYVFVLQRACNLLTAEGEGKSENERGG